MNLAALKLDLIKRISNINDSSILLEIEKLVSDYIEKSSTVNEPSSAYIKVNSLQNEETEKIYIFNEWQQKKINLALEQCRNGACISDEEAEKEIQAWLKD